MSCLFNPRRFGQTKSIVPDVCLGTINFGEQASYAALAQKYEMTPTQLALGFVRSRWFVSSTIIGASSLAQLQETLAATRTTISDELLDEINAIHLKYTNPAP